MFRQALFASALCGIYATATASIAIGQVKATLLCGEQIADSDVRYGLSIAQLGEVYSPGPRGEVSFVNGRATVRIWFDTVISEQLVTKPIFLAVSLRDGYSELISTVGPSNCTEGIATQPLTIALSVNSEIPPDYGFDLVLETEQSVSGVFRIRASFDPPLWYSRSTTSVATTSTFPAALMTSSQLQRPYPTAISTTYICQPADAPWCRRSARRGRARVR